MIRLARHSLLLWAAGSLLHAAAAASAEAPDDSSAVAAAVSDTVTISHWLQLGPLAAPLPAFHAAPENGFPVADLLEQSSLDPRTLRPRAGEWETLASGQAATWQETAAGDGGFFSPGEKGDPAEVYLAVYLAADRWLTAELALTTGFPVKAYLDGEAISLSESDGPPDTPGPQQRTGKLKLAIGKHRLLVHAVFDPEQEATRGLTASLVLAEDIPAAALEVACDPVRAVDINDILDAPHIDAADLSPDGRLVAVSLSEYGPDGKRDRRLEIRSTRDGALQRTWRGGLGRSRVTWAPTGQRLSYSTTSDDLTTIWLFDLASGETTALVSGVENLGGYRWAPDGSFLVYSFTVEAESDERKVKRVRNPADRQPRWRDRSFLVQVGVPGGATRRLTCGPLSTTGWSISADSERLLFFRSEQDLTSRPYSTSELWQLDLASLTAEQVLDEPWIGAAVFGPEPGRIALQGSPSAFDDLGLTLPEGVQPNDYGGQLYLYDLATGRAEAGSRDHDPAIGSLRWSLADGRIYALCVDGQFRNLYAFAPEPKRWTRIETGLEFTAGFDLARKGNLAVAWGTSAATPNRLYALDLRRGKPKLLLDPAAERYQDVTFGEVQPWQCPLPDGGTLDGRVHFPRSYHPAGDRKYPVIVYYYGGTYPVTRDFGGRYPKNIWAGQDYFVYVPQPSGAVGYGQEFSARHVNDWGHLTAAEVIAGTKAFLAAFPAADPDRVGCLGASYGGFLTMLLVSQTDLFAAAVSHAGISSISSYWGEGLWGYAYGARALAHRFPWTDRDLYIGQRPLFHADKITTPMLLVHGAADTNVPVGESTSLFVALKLLGREVEFVRIEGQDHWILDHDQRIVWNDTILAFFARWLKDRPGWWGELYPDPEKSTAAESEAR